LTVEKGLFCDTDFTALE